MRIRIACMVLVWLASATVTRADWGVNQNQDLEWLVGDAQFFAPRDLSDFDTKPRANEGVFFTADYLHWRVTPPRDSLIGDRRAADPGRLVLLARNDPRSRSILIGSVDPLLLRVQMNSLDTSWYRVEDFGGQDFSLGWVEDNYGWFVRGFEMHGRDQQIDGTDTMVAFADPQQLLRFVTPPDPIFGGPADITYLGVQFEDLKAELETRFWTVEANFMYRFRTHYGDWLEFFAGPRYLNFSESFDVRGWGGILDDSWWYTDAHNHIVGPQIGLRYFKRYSSWQVSVEGRFMPAVNFQDIRQMSHLASTGGGTYLQGATSLGGQWFEISPASEANPFGEFLAPLQSSSNDSAQETQFSVVSELRVQASYIVTRKINLKIGYNLMYVSGLARPTSMVEYTFPQMGIRENDNNQSMFAHGFNFGVEINH